MPRPSALPSMVEQVDAGPIDAIRRVAVPAGTIHTQLDVLTYAALIDQMTVWRRA